MNRKREKRVSTRASERDRNMERYLPICITLVNRFSILMWVSEAMAINNEKLFVAHLDFLIYCPFLPTHRHTKAQRQRARQVVKYTSNSDFIEQPQQTAFHVFLSLGRIWLVCLETCFSRVVCCCCCFCFVSTQYWNILNIPLLCLLCAHKRCWCIISDTSAKHNTIL